MKNESIKDLMKEISDFFDIDDISDFEYKYLWEKTKNEKIEIINNFLSKVLETENFEHLSFIKSLIIYSEIENSEKKIILKLLAEIKKRAENGSKLVQK